MIDDTTSNDNLFGTSILRQVPEIWYFHQFSFTYQKSMLNSQQNFHWSFNSSWGNTIQLSQPVSLRGLPSYIQNEQQTLFINPTEIPPAWSNTAKCAQGWHSGLSPPHPYEFVEKLKKRFCMLSMFTIINKVTWNLLNLVSVISFETQPIT